MSVITATTFSPLKSYVRVRLAQGVPIVDADVNEREDISMYELRAFLKWFVGDGVPEGNNGFQITESAGTKVNNFTIRSGFGATATDPLVDAGRAIVNGLDVMITADVEFTAQDLIETRADIVTREATFHAKRVLASAINAPPIAGVSLFVWLDVWDALWTPADDPSLRLPGLGIDTCSRERRYWAVRVRTSSTPPVTGDLEFSPGHAYYCIARIDRPPGDQEVKAAYITDMREKRLLVPPATLIEDLFGPTVLDYRRGLNRPPISFRTAINALIRGEIPATPETVIAPSVTSRDDLSRGVFFVGSNIVITWMSDRGGAKQVWTAQLDTNNPAAGFVNVASVTPNDRLSPHAAPFKSGEIALVYEATEGNEDVFIKRATFAQLNAAAPVSVSNIAGRQRRPFVVPYGPAGAEEALVMWYDTPTTRWQFNRYIVASNSLPGAAAQLSPVVTTATELHAAKDSADTIWAAFTEITGANTGDIQVVEVNALGATASTSFAGADADKTPFVLIDTVNRPWVFWVRTSAAVGNPISIMYSHRDAAVWSAPLAIPNFPAGNYSHNNPVAVTDVDGAIWVFWDSFLNPGGNKDIWYARLDPVSGVWTGSRPTTGTGDPDQTPFALSRRDGVIWLFWNRIITARTELFFRRLITTV